MPLCIHNVFHVSLLKKCVPNVDHIIDWNVIQVEPEGGFQVRSIFILDKKVKKLQNQAMELVKEFMLQAIVCIRGSECMENLIITFSAQRILSVVVAVIKYIVEDTS
jgi:hypothetical protein